MQHWDNHCQLIQEWGRGHIINPLPSSVWAVNSVSSPGNQHRVFCGSRAHRSTTAAVMSLPASPRTSCLLLNSAVGQKREGIAVVFTTSALEPSKSSDSGQRLCFFGWWVHRVQWKCRSQAWTVSELRTPCTCTAQWKVYYKIAPSHPAWIHLQWPQTKNADGVNQLSVEV